MKRRYLFLVFVCGLLSLPSVLRAQTNLLDNSFGTKGTVMTAISGGNGSDDEANAIAIQPDGKIVLVGKSEDASNHYAFALARYNTDGSFDNTFGTNGTVRTPFLEGGIDDEAICVVLQSDGKIVVAGFSEDGSSNYAFAIARYDTDGTLDNSFGSGGEVRTQIVGGNGKHDLSFDVVIQPNGKIIVAGLSTATTGVAIALVRYNSDGTLDANFGSDGTVRTPVRYFDHASYVRIEPNSEITVGGIGVDYQFSESSYTWSWPNYGDVFEVIKYNSDGTIDNSFGTNGIVRDTVESIADSPYWNPSLWSVVAQPDGKFMGIGYSNGGSQYIATNPSTHQFLISRFDTAGIPDLTFGLNGVSVAAVKGGTGNDYGHAAVVQSDGKIVVVGPSDYSSSLSKFALARFNSDGSVDSTFGIKGSYTNSVNGGAGNDEASCAAVQSDGKIVLAGRAETGSGGWAFALARYLGTATAIQKGDNPVPKNYLLSQNYPNPFNPTTTIRFDLKTNSTVRFSIFNVLGQRVQEFDLGRLGAGSYSQTVDMSRFASGVYFYRLEAMASDGERFAEMKKMVLIK